MPAWVSAAVGTYQKRLPRHLELTFREFAPAQRSAGMTADKIRAKEAGVMLKALPAGAYAIALDERGKQWNSRQLATQLEGWQASQPQVYFLIGGADGLEDSCRERAAQLWSLSALTLPHALVRVVLAEQIYRAWTLIQGHPYHRD